MEEEDDESALLSLLDHFLECSNTPSTRASALTKVPCGLAWLWGRPDTRGTSPRRADVAEGGRRRHGTQQYGPDAGLLSLRACSLHRAHGQPRALSSAPSQDVLQLPLSLSFISSCLHLRPSLNLPNPRAQLLHPLEPQPSTKAPPADPSSRPPPFFPYPAHTSSPFPSLRSPGYLLS